MRSCAESDEGDTEYTTPSANACGVLPHRAVLKQRWKKSVLNCCKVNQEQKGASWHVLMCTYGVMARCCWRSGSM